MAEDTKLARASTGGVSTGESSIPEAGDLIKGTIDELDRVLDAKQVVGEPMTFGSTTVVPLVSMGFGFGAGGGGGSSPKGEQGGGGGGGGAGGVKPIAILVISEQGVRLEPIPESPSGIDRLGRAIAGVLEKRAGNSGADD